MDNKTLKFSFWRARPNNRRNRIGNEQAMAKLIELANKGIRARVEAIVKGFAAEQKMESHIGKTFSLDGDHVRFKCSDQFGEAFKKAYPKLNVIKDPEKIEKADNVVALVEPVTSCQGI